ncbi:MAG: sigma-70 family RNA polymerase sigma factor [Kiritimatiellae bacterium]|nr:sigma-70 family RNA polymerase sigma factor [Kiritimatiellia bacterium]
MDVNVIDWPERLSANSQLRDASIAELRAFLLNALRGKFSARQGIDESILSDIVQEALLKILDQLATFEGRSRFTTWAMAIAVRMLFIEMRRRHWGHVSLDALNEKVGFLEQQTSPAPSPSEEASQKNITTLIHAMIQSELTPLQRDVLLADLHAIPQDEIAQQLGRSRKTIYKIGHDARKALKKTLEKAGYTKENMLESFARESRGNL